MGTQTHQIKPTNFECQASLRPPEKSIGIQNDASDSEEFIEENSKETDLDWIDYQNFQKRVPEGWKVVPG
jgi:hypothetical protein